MTPEERAAFLERPLCAVVSTLRADGSPSGVPVWYRWDGSKLLVWSGEDRAWVRHLLRDPRVAVTIAEHGEPYGAVLMRGTARVASGRDAETFAEIRRICARYVEADEVDETIDAYETGSPHAIVTVEPDWIGGWATPS